VARVRRWQPAARFGDPATVLATGLLEHPARAWGAAPHTAAALAWKAYAWWLVTPAVRAYATGGPLPRLGLDNVEVALSEQPPFVEFRVLDPAPLPDGGVERLQETLLERHLAPVAHALVSATRIGRRTLWGSVAEAVAAPLLAEHGPASAHALLDGLGLADLVHVRDGGCARRTCCQAIAVPGLGVCDNCPVQRARRPVAAVAG
jgi:ferric iron reductase protein FhuF